MNHGEMQWLGLLNIDPTYCCYISSCILLRCVQTKQVLSSLQPSCRQTKRGSRKTNKKRLEKILLFSWQPPQFSQLSNFATSSFFKCPFCNLPSAGISFLQHR
jgi:hypothetical protein